MYNRLTYSCQLFVYKVWPGFMQYSHIESLPEFGPFGATAGSSVTGHVVEISRHLN